MSVKQCCKKCFWSVLIFYITCSNKLSKYFGCDVSKVNDCRFYEEECKWRKKKKEAIKNQIH